MDIKQLKKETEKLGTHYEIYANNTLVHREFCRRAAQKIVKKMIKGQLIGDILQNKSNQKLKGYRQKIEVLKETLNMRLERISQLKRAIKIEKNRLIQCEDSLPEEIRAKKLSVTYAITKEEGIELLRLLKEMEQHCFSNSSELSQHIKANNLGQQYPHISGIVTMRDGCDEWAFKGGFPPKIYRIICEELDLENQNSSAKAVDFRSYQDLK